MNKQEIVRASWTLSNLPSSYGVQIALTHTAAKPRCLHKYYLEKEPIIAHSHHPVKGTRPFTIYSEDKNETGFSQCTL